MAREPELVVLAGLANRSYSIQLEQSAIAIDVLPVVRALLPASDPRGGRRREVKARNTAARTCADSPPRSHPSRPGPASTRHRAQATDWRDRSSRRSRPAAPL